MGAASRFKGANTKFSERGEYLLPLQNEKGEATGPANYQLEVRRCIWKDARDKSEFYIAEFEVKKSTNPKVPVGSVRTWMQKWNDAGKTAAADFMFATIGMDRRNAAELAEIKKLDEDGKIPEMLAATLDDPNDKDCQNSLKGFLVDCEVTEIITREKKQKFNKHTFFPVKKEEPKAA